MKTCPDHDPTQHRDGKEPWCHICGLTFSGEEPKSIFEKKEEASMRRPDGTIEHNDRHLDHAKRAVLESYPGDEELRYDQIYIVSFTYILGSFKAMLSTDLVDDRYYEVTYNGQKNETYVDTYVKEKNEMLEFPYMKEMNDNA